MRSDRMFSQSLIHEISKENLEILSSDRNINDSVIFPLPPRIFHHVMWSNLFDFNFIFQSYIDF